jgi:uncharacterized protein YhfF
MLLVRYEDLSLEPFDTVDRILAFLELEPNKLIDQFLETHTQTQRKGSFCSVFVEKHFFLCR